MTPVKYFTGIHSPILSCCKHQLYSDSHFINSALFRLPGSMCAISWSFMIRDLDPLCNIGWFLFTISWSFMIEGGLQLLQLGMVIFWQLNKPYIFGFYCNFILYSCMCLTTVSVYNNICLNVISYQKSCKTNTLLDFFFY